MNFFVLTTFCIFVLPAQFDLMLRIDPCVWIHDLRWYISGKLSGRNPTLAYYPEGIIICALYMGYVRDSVYYIPFPC